MEIKLHINYTSHNFCGFKLKKFWFSFRFSLNSLALLGEVQVEIVHSTPKISNPLLSPQGVNMQSVTVRGKLGEHHKISCFHFRSSI